MISACLDMLRLRVCGVVDVMIRSHTQLSNTQLCMYVSHKRITLSYNNKSFNVLFLMFLLASHE